MTDLISDHLAKLDLTRQVHYTKMHSIDLLVKDLIESLHQTLG
jgi:hypothetical protein